MRTHLAAPLALALLFATVPAAAQQRPQGAGAARSEGTAAIPEPTRIVTHHTARIDGRTVEYDATVGSILLRNGQEEAIGELFYTAYTRTDIPSDDRRPVTFAYNGGPGSASVWLHLGALGPRRVATPDTAHAPPPPYALENNTHSILDVTDLVMIDPIGTGLSRPLGEGKGSDFWGIDEDAQSLSQFIARWLGENGRWNSPRYLLGESYGTTRSAALASRLQRDNIDLNGIMLVSAVLDFQTITWNEGNEMPYIMYLPSYAVTAWYHGALDGSWRDLDALMADVEAFALGDYARALLAGPRLEASERARVLDELVRFTGLSREYLDRADMRVRSGEFMKELMREHGVVVARLDARFKGFSQDPLAQTADYDPQSSAISSAYTSALNAYLREELGWQGDREYRISGQVRPWNWQQGGGFGWPGHTNVADDLADAMRRNPTLEVQLHNGLYDLATPYFAAVWTMEHLDLPEAVRDNWERVDYEAGHMMYVNEAELARMKASIASFIRRTSGASRPGVAGR